jgi:hypothetical protein
MADEQNDWNIILNYINTFNSNFELFVFYSTLISL